MVVNGRAHLYISNHGHDAYICPNFCYQKVTPGGIVKKKYLYLLCLFLLSSTYSQDTNSKSVSLTNQTTTENRNYPSNPWNDIIGSSELDIKRSGMGESLMSNLVCDVMLTRTEADFAFISYGE